jgi:hypothetical protein
MWKSIALPYRHVYGKLPDMPGNAKWGNGRKVFEKIIVGGLFLFFLFQQPTLIFSKTFLPLNLRADNTKLMQKTD